MKPIEIVVGSLYRNSAYPNSLYKGIVAPDGRTTFKIVQSDEMLGKYVVFEEDVQLNQDFWEKFSPAESNVQVNQATEPKSVVRHNSNRESLQLPDGEFSVKELAQKNNVEYVTASQFVKEQETNGIVKRTRTERRAPKGPETQLFQKI